MKLFLILISVFSLTTLFGQFNNAQKEKFLNNLLNDTELKGDVKSIKQIVLSRRKKWDPGYIFVVAYDQNGVWKEIKVLGEQDFLFKKRVLNNDGLTQSITTFTEDGDTAFYTTYEYGPHGLTREFTQDFTNEQYEGYGYGYKYKYEDGKMIEKRGLITANGRKSTTSAALTCKYDEDGKLIQKLEEEGGQEIKTTYYGDTLIRIHQMGKEKIKLEHLDENGKVYKETYIKEKIEREYDDEGYITSESEPVEEIYSTVTFTYNDHGDLIKKEAKGKMHLINTMEYKYDEKGNIISYVQFTQRDDELPIKIISWSREITY